MCSLNQYGFPNEPYDIQSEFCSNAWKLYEIDGGIGIFESPTGTGKTLSILCSSLSWINQKFNSPVPSVKESKKVPIWVANKIIKSKEEVFRQYIDLKSCFLKYIKNDIVNSTKKNIEELKPDESFDSLSSYKVIISSRTHTQLMQFVDEFVKIIVANKQSSHIYNIFSMVSLASRSHLCLHKDVKNYPAHLINEFCKLYSSDEKKDSKCTYKENYMELAKKCLIKPMNIEELCREGQALKACPYYAVKDASKYSDIVLTPYSIILNKATRESFGIHLDKSKTLCFIDEAHNLINALESNNRVSITLLSCQILSYSFEKMITLNSNNHSDNFIAAIRQLERLTKCIFLYTSKIMSVRKRKIDEGEVKSHQILLSPLEFMNNQINTFDLNKIISLIDEHELCIKVKEIITKFGKDFPIKLINYEEWIYHSNSLFLFRDFLIALICSDKEFDKIIIETCIDQLNSKQTTLTMVPINVQSRFADLFVNTKSTVLVGGTLEPLTEFQPLLSSIDPTKIVKFSANYEVPKSNLMCMVIPKFIDNSLIDLRYEYRTEAKQLLNLCELLSVISLEVPNGICVFFSSYTFLDVFFKFLVSDNSSKQFYQTIIKNKKIFKEKRYGLESGKELLKSYKDHILNCKGNGAILFSVLNGTLSEGVNFSDDLCRCLIIISLPFPQKTEMFSYKERYFNNSNISPGQYDSVYRKILCMKTINQCIGRAIRHRNDYSTILLVDSRYNNSEIKKMLPKWVIGNMTDDSSVKWNFEKNIVLQLRNFYNRH
ncbi:putative helicase [Cryptosporidium canis]|uniref:Helicase n=1 Tax=Cryptosporidium canis TaxID=195482 RepID=A0A9D5DFD5_9CRYT|nr:putative helicase [Cryptosporidium canis]